MAKIYLDYNATAPIRPEVINLMMKVMSETGNASSVHGHGRAARKYVEDARIQVANMCGVDADQVIFTSGATEATNAALNQFKDKKAIISSIEHPAVKDSLPNAIEVPVTSDGLIDMNAYEQLINEGAPPALVSIMLVNSETGVIQPIAKMAKMAKEKGALFHTEVVQAAGRIDINLETLGVDYMSLSAHKFAGPQGIGALILRKGLEAPKFMRGGGQERNCRAGTHNTAGIAGMGLAAEMATAQMDQYQKIGEMRETLEKRLKEISNKAIIYGENAPRICNTTNVGLPSLPAQTQLMSLDLDGISVSSGSACSSGTFKPSDVLMAMGVSEEDAKCALRISLGWNTTSADIDAFITSWSKLVDRHKN
ncbi:MAG: cysteine desulfurase family protein [Pseudomonadota bacterium]